MKDISIFTTIFLLLLGEKAGMRDFGG